MGMAAAERRGVVGWLHRVGGGGWLGGRKCKAKCERFALKRRKEGSLLEDEGKAIGLIPTINSTY
jgi:hypothetical protein